MPDHVPTPAAERQRRLSRRELAEYRKGRDAAFADLCDEIAIRGLLCEV